MLKSITSFTMTVGMPIIPILLQNTYIAHQKKTIPDKISKIAKGCSFFFPAAPKLRYGVGKQMTLVPHIDS